MMTALILVLTMAVPCVRSTITEPCANDRLQWNPVPTATFYRVEGWVLSPTLVAKLIDQDVTIDSILIGCQPDDFFLFVWSANAFGLSDDSAAVYWEPGGGRFLDASNGPLDQWVGQLMCGVVL